MFFSQKTSFKCFDSKFSVYATIKYKELTKHPFFVVNQLKSDLNFLIVFLQKKRFNFELYQNRIFYKLKILDLDHFKILWIFKTTIVCFH